MSQAKCRVSLCTNYGRDKGSVTSTVVVARSFDEVVRVAANKLKLKKKDARTARIFFMRPSSGGLPAGTELFPHTIAGLLDDGSVLCVSKGEPFFLGGVRRVHGDASISAAAPSADGGCRRDDVPHPPRWPWPAGRPPRAADGGDGEVISSLVAAENLLRGRNSVHLKGFGDGMASVHAVVDDALALILPYDAVVWDGDPLKACGFTALVEAYLAAHPTGVAVAFKPRDAVKTLLRSWQGVIGRWPGRVKVVPVDVRAATDALGLRDEVARSCAVLPGWARTYYSLGRAAMRVSGSARVVALGGGGIAAREAEAGIGEGVAWTVFALGRGKKESHASLCDMAAAHPQVTLIRGKDPDEALAFSGGCPPTKTPPRPARTGPPSPATAARRAKKPPSAGHHGTGHGAAAADAGGAGARPRNTRKPRGRVQGSWAA